MAKDSSFDIVSEIDMQELDNAFQQSKKQIKSRYDLKDTDSDISLDKNENILVISAPSDFVCSQIKDIVLSKCVKRSIDLGSLQWDKVEPAAGATVRQKANIISGLDKEICSKINKSIKAEKFKVKTQVEGEKIRVSSPKKDTLQDVISFLKSQDFGQPIQFVNYR